jgi:hypothetical protein
MSEKKFAFRAGCDLDIQHQRSLSDEKHCYFFLTLGSFFFKKQTLPWKFARGRKIEGTRS